jgi:hypothetical protein
MKAPRKISGRGDSPIVPDEPISSEMTPEGGPGLVGHVFMLGPFGARCKGPGVKSPRPGLYPGAPWLSGDGITAELFSFAKRHSAEFSKSEFWNLLIIYIIMMIN